MNKVISNSNFQKTIGKISREIGSIYYTVINRGKPRMVVLPYFEGNDDYIEDYLEKYEIEKNREKLQQDLQESLDSGISDFEI